MNRIGFPRPSMFEEKRIALIPRDISKIEHPEQLFFEKGYGWDHNIDDNEYLKAGAHVVSTLQTYGLEIICQPKFTERDAKHAKDGQIVFGWLHLQDNDTLTEALQRKEATAIAWELMKSGGKLVFSRNNLLTGGLGVLHAMAYAGKVPNECRVAVIGRGIVGKGAIKQLKQLRVQEITIYHSGNSRILPLNLDRYDIIVHCARYAGELVSNKGIKQMKPGALLIHLGSDSIKGRFYANSIFTPVSRINQGRNLVYCINHVPTMAYQTASKYISQDVFPYIDQLIKTNRETIGKTLQDAMVMDCGMMTGSSEL